jgi:hypothetical protein
MAVRVVRVGTTTVLREGHPVVVAKATILMMEVVALITKRVVALVVAGIRIFLFHPQACPLGQVLHS